MLDKVIRQSILGIKAANAQYEEWTDERYWLSGGAEYIATVQIARRIRDFVNEVSYVTVEQNIREALINTPKRSRGRGRVRLSRRGRFDIVVWNSAEKALGVIEVKTRTLVWSSVREDVRRVCEALEKFPGLRWGLVAYYMHMVEGKRKTAADQIRARTKTIARNAENHAAKKKLKCGRHKGRMVTVDFESGTEAWRAEVLAFTRD